ncbi:piggyBac transposable element-derived protein 3-like [Xyrichtys novacula]|uniref:PiggyBac transposable element-derived protein 3-like n=1 Tax=Xyrichtys novacula TaxID=13765 RepID=A0AAV1FWL1_XYRNO|nr:piggyBac transposable element-derived protein 3-like [Xyrichtys novacula]
MMKCKVRIGPPVQSIMKKALIVAMKRRKLLTRGLKRKTRVQQLHVTRQCGLSMVKSQEEKRKTHPAAEFDKSDDQMCTEKEGPTVTQAKRSKSPAKKKVKRKEYRWRKAEFDPPDVPFFESADEAIEESVPVALINAWSLYRRDLNTLDLEKNTMPLRSFQASVGSSLVSTGIVKVRVGTPLSPPPVSSPSNSSPPHSSPSQTPTPSPPLRRRQSTIVPPDVRRDGGPLPILAKATKMQALKG